MLVSKADGLPSKLRASRRPSLPRCESHCGLDRNADLKASIAGNGFDTDLAAHILNDAVHDIEPKPGALADSLGGEKRFKNTGLDIRWNSRPVVGDFDEDKIVLARGTDGQVAVAVHGVGGVINQIGPDLIEFAAAGHDFGKIGS